MPDTVILARTAVMGQYVCIQFYSLNIAMNLFLDWSFMALFFNFRNLEIRNLQQNCENLLKVKILGDPVRFYFLHII